MSKKLFIALLSMVVMLAGGAVGYGYNQQKDVQQSFYGDGYVLTLQETAGENIPSATYFTAGTKYNNSLSGEVSFKNMDGEQGTIGKTSFVHYADNSISTLGNGVILKLADLKEGLLNYYGVAEGTILQNVNGSYLINNAGNPVEFENYVWKLSNSMYLVSAPEMTIILPNQEMIQTDGFLEIKYVENGIVQIINNGVAYQGWTIGSKIQMADGMSIDLETRQILQDNEPKLPLESISLDGKYNIALAAQEPTELKVPTFDITTIDGTTGKIGEAGEEGEAGEIGEDGAIGETGAEGDAGEVGKEGDIGEDGGQGVSGMSGNTGDDGQDGATGATGSTGTTDGDTSVDSSIVMPVYSLLEFDGTMSSVKGELTLVQEGSNVTMKEGYIKITNVSTGEVIMVQENINMDGGYFDGGSTFLEFSYEELEPDQEYRIEFGATYEVESTTETGEVIEGERTFVSRSFSTTAYGIVENIEYIEVDTIAVEITKKSYSEESNITVTCTPEKGSGDTQTEQFVFATGESAREVDFVGLDSNTTYIITTYVPEDGGLVEVCSSTYTTLKQAPVLTNAPIVTINARGYFEVQIDKTPDTYGNETFSDVDSGIISYRYEIYEYANNTVGDCVATIDSDGNITIISIDGTNIQRGVTYVTKLVVEFNDNSKIVEYSTPYSESFYMDTQTGVPYMTFTPTIRASDGVDESVYYESIVGTLDFYINGAPVDVGDGKNLRLVMYNALFGEVPLYTVESYPSSGQFSYAIDMDGLAQNTSYRFDVYGYYNDTVGSDEQQGSEYILATCYVTTPKSDAISVTLEDATGDTNDAIAATMYVSLGSKGTEVNGVQYEVNNIATIETSLWQVGNDTAPIATGSVQVDVQYASATGYTSDLSDSYLVEGADDSTITKITLTPSDTYGIDSSKLTGKEYKITIDGFQDYTVDSSERYKSTASFINEIEAEGVTSIVLEKSDEPPALPSPALSVTNVTKEMFDTYGITVSGSNPYEGLSDSTTVGFLLKPKYDNTDAYADFYTMYAFEKTDYENDIPNAALSSTAPLADLKDVVGEGECATYTATDSGTWSSTYGNSLPGVLLLIGVDGTTDNVSGTISDPDNSVTETKRIPYAFKSELERGKRYIFAYDLELTLNEGTDNEMTKRYPYDMADYLSVDYVLRSTEGDTACNAPNEAPKFWVYPLLLGSSDASWNVKVEDVDNTLSEDAFELENGSSGTISSATDYSESSGYQKVAFTDTMKTELTLKANYIEYSKTDSAAAEMESKNVVELLNHQVYTSTPNVTASAAIEESDNRLAITFTDQSGSSQAAFYDQIAGAKIKLTSNNGNTYETTVALSTFGGYATSGYGTYRVTIPLTELVHLKDATTGAGTVSIQYWLYYSDGEYGYSTINDGYYALQSNEGYYYKWDTDSNGNTKYMLSNYLYGSAFDVSGLTISGDTITIPYRDLISSSKSGTLSLTIEEVIDATEAGASATINSNEYAITPRPVSITNTQSTNDVTIGVIIPSVSSPTVIPGLQSATYMFDLTDSVDTLIEANSSIKFDVYEYDTISSTYNLKETIYKTLTELEVAWSEANDAGLLEMSGNYLLALTGLETDTTYKIVMSGDLSGDSSSDYIPFLKNGTTTENEAIFTTLDEVTIAIEEQKIVNQYYNEKYLTFTFETDNYTEVYYGYRIYGADNNVVYDSTTTSEDKLWTIPSIYTKSNTVKLDLSPPNPHDQVADQIIPRMTMGNRYYIEIIAYPLNSEVSDENNVGDIISTQGVYYAALQSPSSSIITTLPESTAEDGTQMMNIVVSLSDFSKVVASNYLYDDDGTTIIDNAGTVTGETVNLQGGYILKIEEEINGENSEQWQSITNNFVDETQSSLNASETVYGTQTIKLQGLAPDTRYRISQWVIVDNNLSGMYAVKPNDIDASNVDGLVLLDQKIQKTLSSDNFYIDGSGASFEQISADQVSFTLYDSVGLSQVKWITATFVPLSPPDNDYVTYSESTGLLEWSDGATDIDGIQVSTTTYSSGNTKTDAVLDIGFQAEGTYLVTVRFYGSDTTEDPLYTISNKYIKISEINGSGV